MKLLYLHDQYYNEEKANIIQVISMCKAFSELGINVTLALLNSGIDETELSNRIRLGFDVNHALGVVLIPTYFKRTRVGRYLGTVSVGKILNQEKPDICYLRSPVFLKRCMDSGISTFFESHTAKLHNRIQYLDKKWRNLIVESSKKFNFIKLIAISEALRNYWISHGMEKRKIIALHDGFNPSFYSKPLTISEARKKLNIQSEKKVVVYAGSLYPDREIETVLALAEKFDNALFWVIGGPEEYKNSYKELAAKGGITNIEFLGKMEHRNIPDYLYAADILLAIWSKNVPTMNYCSPMKVFEYMAAGRIIVAHAFPTIREVLSDSKTALLVDPYSNDDLFHKMEKALNLKYPSLMASQARDEAFHNYSWHARAKKILSYT